MFWFSVHWGIDVVLYVLGFIGACHALLTKYDPRAALGWTMLCLLVPGGFLIYLLFGINHLKVVAHRWELQGLSQFAPAHSHLEAIPADIAKHPAYQHKAFHDLKKTGDHICQNTLINGCYIQPLYDGTEAYPEMLRAIREAKKSVYLVTYIFGTSGVGAEFIDTLMAAKDRGVEVKVLIDGIGSFYSFPSAYCKLRRRGVQARLYLAPLRRWSNFIHMNLRNHRKILTVDGKLGFTGGMNIHQRNIAVPGSPKAHIQDVHFKVEGPIVGFLQEVFLRAWYFSNKEPVKEVIYYDDQPKGPMLCRGIASGPNQKYPQIELMLCAAINAAAQYIRIMTPYFIVSSALNSALKSAVLRGVNVEVILPEANNLSFVKGACEAMLPDLLNYGVKFYYHRGNFAHTKLFVLDNFCVFIGSTNLDVRSLYLNFEFNLEIYDYTLAEKLITHFEAVKQHSNLITMQYLKEQHVVIRFRNALLRLFSPYL